MKTLRQTVSDLMVAAHLIPRYLANHHVTEMTNIEVEERFQMYVRNGIAEKITGTELSVVAAKSRAGNVLLAGCDDLATMTARPRHSTLVPSSKSETSHARFGGNQPAP